MNDIIVGKNFQFHPVLLNQLLPSRFFLMFYWNSNCQKSSNKTFNLLCFGRVLHQFSSWISNIHMRRKRSNNFHGLSQSDTFSTAQHTWSWQREVPERLSTLFHVLFPTWHSSQPALWRVFRLLMTSRGCWTIFLKSSWSQTYHEEWAVNTAAAAKKLSVKNIKRNDREVIENWWHRA